MSLCEGQFLSHPIARVSPGQDELLIRPGLPGGGALKVIEWHHLNLPVFLPSTTVGSLVVRTSLYPLAVLRSRLQLQKQHLVYRNTFHAFVDTARSEGIRGLFRGFLITVPQIGASFVYATVYEGARHALQREGNSSVGWVSGVAGGLASLATQTIFVPTDIVSQYMMVFYKADSLMAGNDRSVMNRLHSGIDKGSLGIRTIKAIYHCDGIKGFYRGFGASALSYVPQCAVLWPTYYAIQEFLHKHRSPSSQRSLMLDQAFAAACGGILATLCTNPFEMMRIRMQMHRGTYKETVERMIRNEGWLMLHKGIAPRLITNTLTSTLLVSGYEIVKRLCVKEEFKSQIQW